MGRGEGKSGCRWKGGMKQEGAEGVGMKRRNVDGRGGKGRRGSRRDVWKKKGRDRGGFLEWVGNGREERGGESGILEGVGEGSRRKGEGQGENVNGTRVKGNLNIAVHVSMLFRMNSLDRRNRHLIIARNHTGTHTQTHIRTDTHTQTENFGLTKTIIVLQCLLIFNWQFKINYP